MFRVIFIAFCLTVPVWSRTFKIPKKICTNGLRPQQPEPQTSEAPYSFSGNCSVQSDGKIQLELKADNDYFLGYIIQAQDAEKKPVGTFKIVEPNKSELFTCSAEGDTLVHIQWDKKHLYSSKFEWLAPVNYKGTVKFVASVAKDRRTYWVGKVSKDVDVV